MIRRHLYEIILESLQDFPVVLLTGARQVGKSTLAQALPSERWPAAYLSLDDRTILDAALRDPDGLVTGTPPPVIIDEVQRAPDLLRAIKRVVDRDHKPGQFLLTGSVNLMTLKTVSESLAGRVVLHELHPFSWSEWAGREPPTSILRGLFECENSKDILLRLPRSSVADCREGIKERILAGGYPRPTLMKSARSRTRWFEGYRQTYLERDLRDMANLEHLPDFNRLLILSALRSGQLINYSDLSRDLGLPFTTLRRYMGLLELSYQVFLVRPYFANVGKRMVKTPKLYFGDTGMACHLAVVENWSVLERQGRTGALVETWVAGELRKLLSLYDHRMQLMFWRTHTGQEVDFLIERGEELAAIEVKWSQQIVERDLAGLHSCSRDLGKRIRLSLVLYPGNNVFAFDARTIAIPMSVFFGIEK
jgi:predicted AAA+ superfamily ATPase